MFALHISLKDPSASMSPDILEIHVSNFYYACATDVA